MATLKSIIRDMLALARKRENIPQRRTLTNGLVVEVAQLPTGDVRLALERRDVAPADAEWKTVMAHWPEPHSAPAPMQHRDGKRYTLVARWPRPAELPLGDMAKPEAA